MFSKVNKNYFRGKDRSIVELEAAAKEKQKEYDQLMEKCSKLEEEIAVYKHLLEVIVTIIIFVVQVCELWGVQIWVHDWDFIKDKI